MRTALRSGLQCPRDTSLVLAIIVLAIVRRLSQGEQRVRDLVEHLALAQSTVSAHVACLRDCSFVEGRPEGSQTFYALARPELTDLLESAEKLLSATGYKVALCENYGTAKENA